MMLGESVSFSGVLKIKRYYVRSSLLSLQKFIPRKDLFIALEILILPSLFIF